MQNTKIIRLTEDFQLWK